MNRMTKFTISSLAAASVAAGGLAAATTGAVSAATGRPAVKVSACSVNRKNYPLPTKPATFRAGAAGTVTITRVNSGTIRVAGLRPASGWRAFVDSSSGSSVDVYFHSGAHSIKFEAEINDAGGLTVTLTSC